MANKIQPKKLLHSKWTAVNPVENEKHFIVVETELLDDSSVVSCLIEPVLSKRTRRGSE